MACCVLMAACCNTSPGNGTGEKPDEPLQMHSGGGLGEWRESCFRGILPLQEGTETACLLCIRHREHSGDGSFVLETADSAERIASGRRYTLRGTASDNDAVVWQLAGEGGRIWNFLYDDRNLTLTLLDGDSVTEYVMEKTAD